MKENFISCMLWVAKGVSKSVPDEVKLSPEELKELIQETREDIKDIEPDFEDDEENVENEEEDEENDDSEDKSENIKDDESDNFEEDDSEEINDEENERKCEDTNDKNEDSDEDIISKYDMDNYDDSDDGRPCMRINDVTMFVDNKDDQYMEDSNSDDEDKKEEEENFQIKNNDNLLVVGHVDGDSCTVEVHVYNKEEDTFFNHHHMDLAAFPAALEWMDFHPSGEDRGNYVAVGDMTPVISVWDLDVVGGNVPDYCLGKKLSKKKKKNNLIGHTESVIALSWNKKLRNILASGSFDKTIILWDLSNCKGERHLQYHEGYVQALEWDPFESHYLLSGCTAGLLMIYDYRTGADESSYEWSVEGEIERVCWNTSQSSKFLCSTDQGFVYGFDINGSTHEFSIKAHKDSVTALDLSPDYPNLLMTGGFDQFIKVWDLDQVSNIKSDQALKPVYSKKSVVGKVNTAKFAPDSELVLAVGGHFSSENLNIMDLAELKPGAKCLEGGVTENDIEELADSVSHSPTQKKKKKKQNGQQSTHIVYTDTTEKFDETTSNLTSLKKKKKKNGQQSTHIVYTDTAEKLDETTSNLTSLKKKKQNGLQSTQNVYAAGPSSTQNNNKAEELDVSVSHAPTSQKMKKKKQRFHPYNQQNAFSAGSSSTGANFVQKKKKHSQIN